MVYTSPGIRDIEPEKQQEVENNLVITHIHIRKMLTSEKLKAIISVTFNYCLAIHDIKVISISKGLFLAFPSHKGETRYIDIAHPVNPSTREYIEGAVISAYQYFCANNTEAVTVLQYRGQNIKAYSGYIANENQTSADKE